MKNTGAQASEFEVHLLGTVQALYGGRPLELGGTLAKSILAVLLLHPGLTVPKDRVIACAWRADPPATADDLVADYVSRLRKAFAPARTYIRLLSSRPGFRAELDPHLVDVHRFTGLVERAGGDRAGHENELAADHLRQALGLWRGETIALADLESGWLRAQSDVLGGKRLDALERLARIELDAGHPDIVADLLHEAVPAHPEREGLTITMVKALTLLGESARAADVAARASEALIDLGQDPGPELRKAQTAALIRRPDRLPAARGPRHQLPIDTSAFTGRERELARLLNPAVSTWSEGSPGTVVISAIDGMAGIGKTALAVHAGHQLANRFPDGQLFLDLHGYTQGLAPREVGDALATILQAYGISPQQIPSDLEARAALYRDCLAGTRTLILLDNANSEAQVRPLLPGDSGCMVLVTSRRRLKALDDARALSLDVLPMPDAVKLFREVAGPGRTPANDPLLEEIATLCGHLPLALRIAAALIRHRPTWTLRHLADKLCEARAGLKGFSDGDRNLSSVFDLSYEALGTDQQLLFRRLGLIPGPDADAYAASALLDSELTEAEGLLQDLVDHNLLAESTLGRYRLHDLIRAHARHHMDRDDTADDRERALDRLLDYYQYTAQQADRHLARLTATYNPPVTSPPCYIPTLDIRELADAWMGSELANLTAAVQCSASRARPTHAVALPAAIHAHLQNHGPWTQAIALHSAAADTAHALGDRCGQGASLNNLGVMRQMTGDYPGATLALAQALDLCCDLGDRQGQAHALNHLGSVRQETGDYPGATTANEQALDLYRALGDRQGQASVLRSLGIVRRMTGDFPGATLALTQALDLYRALGDRQGQAHSLGNLGNVRQETSDYPGAILLLTQALDMYSALGDRQGQANSLGNLGAVYLRTGDYLGATRAYEQALDVDRALGARLGQANALTNLGTVRLLTGDFPGATGAYEQALELYSALGARRGQASALSNLGNVRLLTGDFPGATRAYEQALELCGVLGDRRGQANALNGVGVGLLGTGDCSGAHIAHEQALELYRAVGDRHGQANVLNDLGLVQQRTGDYPAATHALQQALEGFREIGDRAGEAEALNRYARVLTTTGNLQQSRAYHSNSLQLAREIESPIHQAEALEGLGEVCLIEGGLTDGIERLLQALQIYRQLGAPGAKRVEVRLAELA
jgi:tetratricopeptide (TPR) repeat protein/DNA-binding SARP family transcriptional activator